MPATVVVIFTACTVAGSGDVVVDGAGVVGDGACVVDAAPFVVIVVTGRIVVSGTAGMTSDWKALCVLKGEHSIDSK